MVLVLLVRENRLEAGASEEVRQDVSKRFEITATSLLDTQVGVGGVAGSSCSLGKGRRA